MYKVYQLEMNVSATLSLLSLSLKRKVKCYNEYFFNEYVFHNEEYEHGRKIYNNSVCVKGLNSSEFEVDYYGKLEEVIVLQYHNEHNKVFLFKFLGDDVFQVGKLVELYWVTLSIDLEANSIFCVFDNIFVDIDVEELNVVLSSIGQVQVDEDDDSNVIYVRRRLRRNWRWVNWKGKKTILTNYQNMKV